MGQHINQVGICHLLMVGLLMLTAPALAQKSTAKKNKAWSMSFSTDYTTSLYDEANEPRPQYGGLSFESSYTFAKTVRASLALSGSQSFNDKEWENSDPSLGLGWVPTYKVLAARLTYSTGLRFIIPATEDTRANSLYTTVSWGNTFNVSPDYIPTKKLSLSFSLSPAKSFHRYDTAESGKVNTSHTLSKAIRTGWAFTDNFSFNFTYAHTNLWQYRGAQSEVWTHSQSLDWQVNPTFSLSTGHQFGLPAASVYKSDGSSLNIDLVNKDNSYVFFSASMSI